MANEQSNCESIERGVVGCRYHFNCACANSGGGCHRAPGPLMGTTPPHYSAVQVTGTSLLPLPLTQPWRVNRLSLSLQLHLRKQWGWRSSCPQMFSALLFRKISFVFILVNLSWTSREALYAVTYNFYLLNYLQIYVQLFTSFIINTVSTLRILFTGKSFTLLAQVICLWRQLVADA